MTEQIEKLKKEIEDKVDILKAMKADEAKKHFEAVAKKLIGKVFKHEDMYVLITGRKGTALTCDTVSMDGKGEVVIRKNACIPHQNLAQCKKSTKSVFTNKLIKAFKLIK